MSKFVYLVYVALTNLLPSAKGYNFINVAYYELSPYIYRNENGSISGIFPELLDELSNECDVEFRYSMDTLSANNFSNLIGNKTIMMKYLYGNWLWLPLTQHISDRTLKSLKFLKLTILNSGIDILVHRDQVGTLATIKVGIFECRYLFVIGLMLSIVFGTLIWFIERWNNTDFSDNSCGIFTGFWFSLVTMTTVGYGDIIPKSFIGKLLAMVWMVTGVILTAIVTSTITNVYGGLDYLQMGGKRIVTVDGSLEASILDKYNSAQYIIMNFSLTD